MNIAHHPDDATLASYAASCVELNFSQVLDMHIQHCCHCQQRINQAEQLGAALLNQMPEATIDPAVKANLFKLLDQPLDEKKSRAITKPDQQFERLPKYITNWEHTDPDQLPWKRMGPGVRYIPLASTRGKQFLLRIAPGTCLPAHGHQGNELTLVLSGSYSDEIGRFTPGCVADLDDRIDHQPIADRSEDCICLVASDAPLKFHGWAPRLFQSFFQI